MQTIPFRLDLSLPSERKNTHKQKSKARISSTSRMKGRKSSRGEIYGWIVGPWLIPIGLTTSLCCFIAFHLKLYNGYSVLLFAFIWRKTKRIEKYDAIAIKKKTLDEILFSEREPKINVAIDEY
ncbi:hypothetical protein TNIN_229851 [Trichonephila inaurata madagascariensis]|uniref:Transmembrane protein n=1 Tax=Trichonephila inaurata madagascariensis TaxID=2747483 RepID=A0A8X6XFV4_9ARAC|nr:hypothetical protein TNIN_229851 [Trichonephila inaurata madagascariensis]